MSCISTKPIRTVAYCIALGLLATSIIGFAQDAATTAPPSSAPSPAWHRFSNPPADNPPADDPSGQTLPSRPLANDPPGQTVPSRLRLQAGTFVTVRVDQMLSSDRNKAGDEFSATLTRPLVADGVVVAQRGEMLGGRVADAQKAGRVTGVSRLAVQLTDLTLVDGQQVPIETELTNLTGPTSKARDAGAIAGTTVFGAAVGGAAALGPGAAIGAGAGLIAGTVGVLVTRGHPTVIYPESVLTFRLSEPITISTDRAPQAFLYVNTTNQYNRASNTQGPPPAGPGWNCQGYGWPAPAAATPPPNYYYPYSYPYPYYWGPSFTFWYGPGLYYGRGFYNRGFYRR
jgi:hypothetical protein